MTFLTGSIFGIAIRTVEILFALLTWTLAAGAINTFSSDGALAWLLVCGLISFIYATVVLVLNFSLPNYIIPGAILIMESVCALFNFTGFIAAAAVWGPVSCSGEIVGGFYTVHYDSTACRAGKAAIAFGAFSWLLFTITAIIFGIYSIKPLIETRVNWWGPGPKFSAGILGLESSGSSNTTAGSPVDDEATVGDTPVEKSEENVAPDTALETADPIRA